MSTRPNKRQIIDALAEAENQGYILFPEIMDRTMRKRIGENPDTRRLLQQLMDNLDTAKEPSPALTFQLFMMFEKTGNRVLYEAAFFERRRQLFTLVLSYLMDGDASLLIHIEQKLWEWCELTSWELPAHYGPLTKLPLATEPDKTVGLFAAESAFFFAEILYVLGAQLDTFLVYRLEKEIFRRVLTPYLESSYWWESTEMNWSAVCAGSIGAAAIYLVKDQSMLADILERVLGSMAAYLDGFDQDGLTPEGLSYWEYGFSFYMMFFELLSERTGGRLTILNRNKTSKIAMLPQILQFPSTRFVNFSDAGSAFWSGNPGLITRLSRVFDIPGNCDWQGYDLYRDPVYRFGNMVRMLFWSLGGQVDRSADEQAGGLVDIHAGKKRNRQVDKQTNEYLDKRLDKDTAISTVKTGMFFFCESGWLVDRRYIGKSTFAAFAAKGGHNDEPHNHNDLGSFLLHYGGEDLFIELGAPEYVKEYFDNKTRYNFLAASSLGHSVPVINGHAQSSGKAASATVLEAIEQDEVTSFHLELHNAYPNTGLKHFSRKFNWNFEDGVLLIRDRFNFESQGEVENIVEEAFLTAVKPELTDDNKLLLQLEQVTAKMHFPELSKLSIEAHKFKDHAGIERTVYRTSLTAHGGQNIEMAFTIYLANREE